MVVRELLTVLGFKTDEHGMKKAEEGFDKIKESAIHLMEIVGAIEIGKKILEAAGEEEQLAMVFEQALGSAEKAAELMEQINKFSLSTGFDPKSAKEYSKTLLNLGVSGEKIMPTLDLLGNMAVRIGKDKLPTVVEALGKMQAKGQVDSRSFNALLSAQVPILAVLEKQTGLNYRQLKKMGEEGLIKYPMMEQALRSMTQKGGAYYGLLNKQALTLNGIVDRAKNFLQILADEIGKEILPVVKELGTMVLNFLGGNFDTLKDIALDVFEVLAFLFGFVQGLVEGFTKEIGGANGAMKIWSGIMFVAKEVVLSFIAGLAPLIKFIYMFRYALIALTVIWGIWNVMMIISDGVNPVVWVIALIVALGALIRYWDVITKYFWKMITALQEGFKKVSSFLWKLFDNKILQAALAFLMPIIGVPLLIIKNWSTIKGFFIGLFTAISNAAKPFIDWVSNIISLASNFLGGKTGSLSLFDNSPVTPPINKTAGTSSSSQVNVDSTITIEVPTGTPEAQKQMIQKHVERAVKDSWQGIMRDTQKNTQRTDWPGATP